MPNAQPIRSVSLVQLRPYPGNPRRHTKAQIKKLASLIKRYGFTSAIAVDEDHVVLAGHGRLEAAKLLGLHEVPVIRVDGLSEPEKIALRIADNRVADESSFDPKLLSEQLRSLLHCELDLEATAFDAIELDPILRIGEEATSEPEPPLPMLTKRPVSKVGDLWQLGEHSLLCADARNPRVYEQLLNGELAAMVFTDPPWNVKINGHVSGKGQAKHDEFQMASGEMSDEEFRSFLLVVLGNIHAYAEEGSIHYVCMDWRGVADLINVGRGLFSKLLNVVVWAKPNGGMGSFYRSQHELIAVFKKGVEPHINNIQLGRLGRYRSNIWQYPGGSSFSRSRKQDLKDHPTVKPLKMVADAMLDASRPGDLIMDPFGGAGTTLLAAQKTGRRAAVLEIEPRYVDVTLRRFQEMTGIEPILMPDGIPLSAVRRTADDGEGEQHV